MEQISPHNCLSPGIRTIFAALGRCVWWLHGIRKPCSMLHSWVIMYQHCNLAAKPHKLPYRTSRQTCFIFHHIAYHTITVHIPKSLVYTVDLEATSYLNVTLWPPCPAVSVIQSLPIITAPLNSSLTVTSAHLFITVKAHVDSMTSSPSTQHPEIPCPLVEASSLTIPLPSLSTLDVLM